MTVSYAQFLVEFPEFAEIDQTMIDPVLALWDSFLYGFNKPSLLHDRAVYRRSALELSRSVFGMRMTDESTEQDKYMLAWKDILVLSGVRCTVSGGLT